MARKTLAFAALVAVASCGSAVDTEPDTAVATVAPTSYKLVLTEVADGVEFPWGMAVMPSGDMLITEREGRLRIFRDGALDPTPLTGLPSDILVERQGGLLDVTLHPGFDTNRWVYLSYAQGTSETNQTAVIRGRLNADESGLDDVEEIFVADMPEKRGGAHFGCRLAFLNDGSLLITLGDGYAWMNEAQSLENHFGKTVRVTDTGDAWPDNPFFDEGGATAKIYTYGHRNVQGLAYDPARNIIYTHEHGPKGGDELNILSPGTNYGWPEITYGVDYDGTIITTETEAEGMAQPDSKWVPSIAPSGMEFYTGDVYPGWQGDLFIGAMNGPEGRKLVRIDLDDDGQVAGREDLLKSEEILFRDVQMGADGKLYLATAEIDGQIFRLDMVEN